MKIKLSLGFAVVLLIIIFTLQNIEVVSIRFLFWELSVSRVLLIFIIFSSGLFGGYLLRSLTKSRGNKRDTINSEP